MRWTWYSIVKMYLLRELILYLLQCPCSCKSHLGRIVRFIWLFLPERCRFFLLFSLIWISYKSLNFHPHCKKLISRSIILYLSKKVILCEGKNVKLRTKIKWNVIFIKEKIFNRMWGGKEVECSVDDDLKLSRLMIDYIS